jgi:hypothetical protein
MEDYDDRDDIELEEVEKTYPQYDTWTTMI